jgi:hypothetical protein
MMLEVVKIVNWFFSGVFWTLFLLMAADSVLGRGSRWL